MPPLPIPYPTRHFTRVFFVFLLWFATALAAQAQNVLLLTTTEVAVDAAAAQNNVEAEFAAAGATVTRLNILETAGSVTPATFTAAPGPYDIVVLSSAYIPIAASNWTAVQTAIASRAANSFILFIDGCCEVPANATQMLATLNATGAFTATLGSPFNGYVNFPLNTSSTLAGSFAALNPLVGGYITYLNNVPVNNALYLPPATPVPPPGPLTTAYGVLVPKIESYAGAGACVFAVVDLSHFIGDAYDTNRGKVASSFIAAATAENGACGIPASVTKSFGASSLVPGGGTTLTIRLNNLVGIDVPGAQVSDMLPAPLVVASTGTVTSTCTGGTLSGNTPNSNSVGLSGTTIPVGGCTITVPVTWPDTAAGLSACNGSTITNTIRPPAQFSTQGGQVNTPATATMNCTRGPIPSTITPVPTLSETAFFALQALMAFLVLLRLKKTARS